MPTDDVSDLKDVFDAINKLCETMKSTDYESDRTEYSDVPEPIVRSVEILSAEDWNARSSCEVPEYIHDTEECVDLMSTFASAEDISVLKTCSPRRESVASVASSEVFVQREAQEERWSDTQTSPQSAEFSVAKESSPREWSDCRVSPPYQGEAAAFDIAGQCEPTSDMYYTASSEVSLVSDTEMPDRGQQERDSDKEEGKECVIAGHVAAMRERFESMTRANTPCPDSLRAPSPALDVFRNITPSPDHLG